MKIKFIRNTIAQGQPHAIGDVLDLPEAEARQLVALGKAVPFEGKPAPKVESAAVQPVAEKAEAAPKPKPKRKAAASKAKK